MENASKALIIAGAILISILLISVGIMVMNSTSGVQDEMASNMDATQKQSFNAQFNSYAGSSKSASDVKALYNTINSSNASHDTTAQVEIVLPGTGATDDDKIADLSSKKRYKIVVGIDIDKNDTNKTGLVNKITVTEVPTATN